MFGRVLHWGNARSQCDRVISRAAIGLTLVGLTVCCDPLFSSGQPLSEDNALELSLANAYLYLAARTTWPQAVSKENTFRFCVAPEHHLLEVFSKLLPQKKLHERSVTIKAIEAEDSVGQQSCDLIALSKDEALNRKVIQHVRGLAVLTISDEADITSYGGLVFLSHDKKLEPPKVDFSSLATSTLSIDAAVLTLSQRRWGAQSPN
ncbi:MAG: YfiR family protein [Bdellovibrionota bacterium]